MSDEPSRSALGGAQRWADYLDWIRAEMVSAVLALAYDDQRTSRVPSGWTPLELLHHVLHMEQRWFVWGFLAEPVADPWGDWSSPDAPEARWAVPSDVTAEELTARLEAVAVRTRGVLRDHALDATASTGGRFDDDPPTLEWICFHVLAEYARHAGHLDIVAEQSRD
ncbi:Mini-circle protein [Nocardioides sp. Soil777]|uniref:mycothiol transferase n=1 Tax=Nocardioides sp. Soil777 TaxID=1736409 RepID=UPI000703B823|nr:DUF664 domain-containing protein [Nocardioides sp. Soil777]KRF04729.1 Mini-circle protein [Nocardioides sp. Soil777]